MSLAASLRRALQGYCPNCLMGHLFEGLIRPRMGCDVCLLVYERDSSTWMGAAFFIYLTTCLLVAAEGVTLALLFGFFPGLVAILGVSVPLVAGLLYRPVRGVWIWFLWRLGFLA